MPKGVYDRTKSKPRKDSTKPQYDSIPIAEIPSKMGESRFVLGMRAALKQADANPKLAVVYYRPASPGKLKKSHNVAHAVRKYLVRQNLMKKYCAVMRQGVLYLYLN
jgi:hypothetical protein